MRHKLYITLFMFSAFALKAQVKLCLDSTLKAAYIKKYGFYEGLMCVPFFCDPFCTTYKKGDTAGLCGKYVFVDTGFRVKIKPGFEMPCSFEPRFSEGLCAVGMNNKIVFIDTSGKVVIKTELSACSGNKNRVVGFKNGLCKVYKGSGGIRNVYDIYFIDKKGKRQAKLIAVKVKLKPPPVLASNTPSSTLKDSAVTEGKPLAGKPMASKPMAGKPVETTPLPNPVFEVPKNLPTGKYPVTAEQAAFIKRSVSHNDNRMLVYFDCGQYQFENMALQDTVYCRKFVFIDTNFNVKIAGFSLPCGFEPEFSEGLCAVAKDGYLVYIDTNGAVRINTGLKSCDSAINKASTFKNGIATLYLGDKKIPGYYSTMAINTLGNRVKLLEFDDLALAEMKIGMFKNLTPEECANCFVGRGKTNGIWFLIEKNGKVKKKLELK